MARFGNTVIKPGPGALLCGVYGAHELKSYFFFDIGNRKGCLY